MDVGKKALWHIGGAGSICVNETFLVVFDFHFDQQQRVERIERCDGYELLDVDPLELTAERSHLALAPRQPQEHEEYRREGREQGVSEHDAMRHDSRHAGEAEAFEGAGEELEEEEQGEQPAQAGAGRRSRVLRKQRLVLAGRVEHILVWVD